VAADLCLAATGTDTGGSIRQPAAWCGVTGLKPTYGLVPTTGCAPLCEPLDTAGAIRFAADAAGIDDTFVVANGDVLTDLDVSQLVAFHREHGAEATIHLIGVPDPSAFGVVALQPDGRVERFVEKPAPGTEPSNLINAGTYVLEPSVLARIPSGQKVSIERATFPAVVADGGLYAMATDDYWLDTGRPELYLQANLDLVRGVRVHDRCRAVHADAVVAPGAHLDEAVVGPRSSVADGATVVRSVLLPGAVVEAGASVTDSVVMGRIGAGADVRDSVVGAEATVAPGEHLAGVKRPDPSAS
jgi:mannose-1-phosphate guanylyltransferase